MIEMTGHVTVADIASLAASDAQVAVEAGVRHEIENAALRAKELSRRYPTYGRSTGVGANRLTSVATGDSEHGLRLLRSHATDAGSPVAPRAVRAMLGVRLAQLCMPGSGVRPEVLDGLARMLNEDALPLVLEYGGIGTADLSALAGTALTLMGERPATRPFEPMALWGSENALPFMSSSALTVGRGCLAVSELDALLRAVLLSFGLSFVALNGNTSPFSAAAARASASPGMTTVAERLRSIVGNAGDPARIQDPYGLRAFPINTASAWAAVERLRSQLEMLLNVAQENPLFVLEGEGAVVHHAGFYQSALGLATDGVNAAIAQTAPITLSRIRMMNEPDMTGLRPFLAEGPSGASGLMMVEYVAAAALADLRQGAQPASLGTVVISRGTEEDASFATQAVGQLEQVVAALRVLLACELVGSARLLRQRRLEPADMPTEVLGQAMQLAMKLPDRGEDRALRDDIAEAQLILNELAELST